MQSLSTGALSGLTAAMAVCQVPVSGFADTLLHLLFGYLPMAFNKLEQVATVAAFGELLHQQERLVSAVGR